MPSSFGRPVNHEGFAAAAKISDPLPAGRIATFFFLAISEIIVGTSLFELTHISSSLADYANFIALIVLLASFALAIIVFPNLNQLLQAWRLSVRTHNLAIGVVANLSVFALLLLVRMSLADSELPSDTLYLSLAYCILIASTGATLAVVAAPLSFWRYLFKAAPLEILLALFCAGFILGAIRLSKDSWDLLSATTLALSYWILSIYEANPIIDTQNRVLGSEEFHVQIWAPCSGYEGVGLIVAFLGIYLWVFRSHLRFPNALLLFPAGIIAIWILNSLRIAILVSIGAHISPAIAVNGFHSWAGWIMFLAVTVGTMAVAPRIRCIWKRSEPNSEVDEDPSDRYVFAFLAPFAALMAASIVASAFAPADQWLYALKVVAVGATLWWFRDVYASLISSVSPVSVAVGLIIGALWIATDPNLNVETPLGPWVAGLPAWLAVLWLALRAFGAILLVPVAEELAFRGYLYRALTFMRFDALGPVEFRWFALAGSSLAFGILHERWLAATLAGAVYALLMYRSKKLVDPIAAHMASNAAIVVWSISTEQWSLL